MGKNIDINIGLTQEQVNERIRSGLVNYDDAPKTKTIGQIIRDNFFTYFNFLNLMLGIAAFTAGVINGNFLNGLKNCLFMGVIIVNSIISIIEEIISKKIIDKLSMVSENKADVLRDGVVKELPLDEIVMDDIVKLSLGHQIVSDCVVVDGEIEVNESLITGESDAIKKKKGDELLSGSFIVSGRATARVIHVGKDNYVSKISSEAKYKKEVNSIVMQSFTKMLKILSALIIPIGIVMLINQYLVTYNLPASLYATVASLIGMIPEGLILLTSSVMAVGIIKLYRVNVLVQELCAIETLARVDAICLDKTGTLTEGKMKVVKVINSKNYSLEECEDYLAEYTLASLDNNQTMLALKDYYKGDKVEATNRIDFSSERKFSAIEFDDYCLYLGAPDIVLKNNYDQDMNKYVEDYRVIALGYKKGKLDVTLSNIKEVGYVLIEDVIRPSAKKTLDYFKNNNVLVKIISGDNVKTVMSIAKKVGLDNITGIDIGNLSDSELKNVIDEYQVFGRVKPEQKKCIIKYLKSKGHVVAMTGDGVNDVLALKESDCAISIKSGTDAARNVSQLILLDDDFNSLPRVVAEGRQTINNVERSASLLLYKTIFTILLILFSIISFQQYFFEEPIQISFITTFTIGVPSFILALETNDKLVEGNFLFKVFSRSLPTALTVVFNVIIVSAFSALFGISHELESSICVILTTITGLFYLFKICYPLNVYRGSLFFTMLIGFIYCVIFQTSFFKLVPINYVSALIIFVLTLDSIYVYKLLNFGITKLFHHFDKTIKVESDIYKIN